MVNNIGKEDLACMNAAFVGVQPFRHAYRTIQSFQTDGFGQTVQPQIRLLLEEQSDQGLHCLLFHLHLFDEIPLGLASLFEF